MIQPIVEGHGEVSAVPVLLRAIAQRMAVHYVEVASPIRRPRSKLVQQESLVQAVELARIQLGCQAILILLDADDDCPKTFVSDLQGWAQHAAHPIPCAVVLANREYEGWFLSCIESLRGCRGILETSVSEVTPEGIRGAKAALEDKMKPGRKYLETTDQAALSALADWEIVYGACRSFRKFVKETKRLLAECNLQPAAWPN
jgi:hypothetical protein